MYSIILVDDEKIICDGLKSKIRRMHNIDIENIYIAHNGIEALEIINKDKPNILITDIKMPKMNGIELISEVLKINTNIKFIVLSGYDEYKYVREAFKLGAVDYLLKPVSITDFEDKLKSVIKILDAEINLKNIKEYNNDKNLLELELNKLFMSGDKLNQTFKNLMKDIEENFSFEYFCLASLSLNNSMYFDENNISNKSLIENVCSSFFKNTEITIFKFNDYKNNTLIIFNFKERENYNLIVEFLNNLTSKLNTLIDNYVFASLSEIDTNSINLLELYSQTQLSLSYKIIENSSKVIEYKNILLRPTKFFLNKNDIKYLDELIKYQDISKISEFIDTWFSNEKLKNQSIENVKKLYYLILHKIKGLIPDEQLIYENEEIKDFIIFNTLEELKYYLKNYTFKVKQQIVRSQNKEKNVVDIAKKYIEENFNKDINLAQISNIVSLNYSYFSKLFKDQTGMTFSVYLTNCRMEEAKKLLSIPQNNISEISLKVGYDNIYIFSRAFKNHFGVSPQNFRKINPTKKL